MRAACQPDRSETPEVMLMALLMVLERWLRLALEPLLPRTLIHPAQEATFSVAAYPQPVRLAPIHPPPPDPGR